jgi:hypothetical protein
MLRISLLPNYIYDRAKRRNVIVLWSVVVALIIVGFMSVKIVMDRKAARLAAAAAQLKPTADEATQTESKATSIQNASADIKTKADFVSSCRQYDMTTYPPVYHNIAEYTIRSVVYDSITPSGSQVAMQAFAPSLAQLGHYMMWMEHNPKISNLYINLSNFRPTFPSPWKGGNQTMGGQYVTTEIKTKQDAIDLVLGGGRSGGGMSGFGGGPSGSPYPGMMPPSFASSSMTPMSPMMGPMSGGNPYSMGTTMGQGGGGGEQDDNYPHYRPTDANGNLYGYTFGVTLTLVTPIPAPPTYSPGSSQKTGGASNAQGGMGGFPGGMGGFPVEPGGMSGPMGAPGGMASPSGTPGGTSG